MPLPAPSRGSREVCQPCLALSRCWPLASELLLTGGPIVPSLVSFLEGWWVNEEDGSRFSDRRVSGRIKMKSSGFPPSVALFLWRNPAGQNTRAVLSAERRGFMSGGIGGTLERHTVCSLACRCWQSATLLWVRVRSPIGLEPPNLLKLCNHRGRILPATPVEQDSRFLNSPSNLPQATIGMLACYAYMPTNQ